MRTPPGEGGVAETIERHFKGAPSTAPVQILQHARDRRCLRELADRLPDVPDKDMLRLFAQWREQARGVAL